MTLNDRERAAVRDAIDRLTEYRPLAGGTIAQVLTALRQLDTEPGRPADATGDSFEALIADMDDVIRGFPSTTTARFRDRLRDLVAAEMLNEEQNTPEVVSRDKVNDLPRGSRVVGSTEQGQAVAGGIVREVGVGVKLDLYHHYLVLHRAPQPPIKVGDVLDTQTKIDRAARVPGLVVRGRFNHVVAEAGHDGTWLVTGRARSYEQRLTPTNQYIVLHVDGKGDNQ